VRIIKEIVASDEWRGRSEAYGLGERSGSEDPPLHKLEKELKAETLRPTQGEKPTEEKGDWLDCEESMGQGSMGFDYCQGPVLSTYHSNETGGSGVIGRSWGEFQEFVRQEN
jgi:hypothetical protein